MQPEEIKVLLDAHLPGCQVNVAGEGANFQIRVVGPVFESLNAVKRQQAVYAAINEQISAGAIHAVTIQTYTPAEWASQS